MQLKGKTAIITGAAGGIGRATVLRFVGEGARVVAADIQGEGAEETARIIGADYPGAVIARGVDVSRGDQVERLISETVSHFGKLDIIFSNAAIMRDGSVIDLPEEDWDALFDANVKGAFLCGKYGIPAMRQSGGGSFIITASVNSFYAESDIAGYCATKGAVLQLARAMAIDHGPEGVRVNCICPGWIETAMSQPFLEENPEGRGVCRQNRSNGAHRSTRRCRRGGTVPCERCVAVCHRSRLYRRRRLDSRHDKGTSIDLM